VSHPFCGRVRTFARLLPGLAVLAVLVLPRPVLAQRVVSQAERVISVSRGASALFVSPVPLQRFSVGDPGIAEVTIVSPTEVVINGRGLGSTTLLIWDNSSDVKVYSVEVTADAPALERYIRSLLPNEEITVTASGGSITLSGTVKNPVSAQRAVEIARTAGATIIDNLVTPPAVEVKLKVRFAEINRTALRQWAANLSTLNPHKLSDGGDWSGATSADGTIDFLLDNGIANLQAFITASSARGDFRSLAEPNLMVLPGREAYFLAGGRFPFPAVQGGGASNAIGIQFEEFGVRLRFTPVITRSGSIRIKVEPEVSSLDFANGLVISGFVIPSILTRKATTEVELKEGQFLAIAGLLDNSTTDNVAKIPVLGDIPILGELFRSKNLQQRRTELLVLVTPQLVTASDQATPVPTGETDRWNWQRPLEKPAPNTPAADSAAAAARSQ
jgi:pilus assembly protein CpaC